MTHEHGSLSSGRGEDAFDLSYRLACEQLAKISDVRQQCLRSGARYIGPNDVVIGYLNESYRIRIPNCKISLDESGAEARLIDKILLLHYFTRAKGTEATGELITFKQLSGGVSYFPAFSQRAIGPLLRKFGSDTELFRKAAAKLGGREAGYGDASVTINAFDRVPITLVLWRGDEDVAPNGSILFDASVSDYLPTEDVTVVCETIIRKLARSVPSTEASS